ncbi:MAG: hypothetical protein WBP58_15660 [Chitinophagaceae bacterium]
MKSILFFLLIFCSIGLSAQNLPDFDQIRLEQGSDYKPAEPAALQAANYILSTPIAKDDVNRLLSLRFLLRWMTGTPDYTFSLGGNISKAVANNEDLLGVYMAAMAKYALENSAVAKDEKKVNLEATKMMLAYCEDEKNNVKLNKTLKKMIEANKEGKLESML